MFSFLNKSFWQQISLILGLAFLVLLLRWPAFDIPLRNDAGAQAYHARLIFQGEPLYSSHHSAHHLPGVYYTYALAFWLFGDETRSIRLMAWLWVSASAYVLYRLGRSLHSPAMGISAALFYSLMSSQRLIMGPAAQIEIFANLPRLLCLYFALWPLGQAVASPLRRRLNWLGLGFFGGLSLLFKVTFISPLLIAAWVLIYQAWQKRQQASQFLRH